MTYSRRQLYALGEPFGASATEQKPGAGIRYGGGGGGGGSTSESNPVTTNTDKRVAVQDGMGISGDGSSVRTDNNYSTNIFDSRRTDNSSQYSSAYTDTSQKDYSTNIADSRQTNSTDSRQFSSNDSRQFSSSDSRQWADNSVYTDNSNSSDAIKAMTDAGAAIIRSSGESVVDLARFQGAQNTDAWNTTLSTGANLIDKLIGQAADGMKLSSKVVDSFTPTETKTADTGKYAMIAAAVSVALFAGNVLLKAKK